MSRSIPEEIERNEVRRQQRIERRLRTLRSEPTGSQPRPVN